MFLGWRALPPDYPLHQAHTDTNTDNITNWVHNIITHKEYLYQKLFVRDKFNHLSNGHGKMTDLYVKTDGRTVTTIANTMAYLDMIMSEFGYDVTKPVTKEQDTMLSKIKVKIKLQKSQTMALKGFFFSFRG